MFGRHDSSVVFFQQPPGNPPVLDSAWIEPPVPYMFTLSMRVWHVQIRSMRQEAGTLHTMLL